MAKLNPLLKGLYTSLSASHRIASTANLDPNQAKLAAAVRDVLIEAVLSTDETVEQFKALLTEKARRIESLYALIANIRPASQTTAVQRQQNLGSTSIPAKYKEIILNETDPGQIYFRCLAEMKNDHLEADHSLTTTIIYATEVAHALDILKNGRPESWGTYAALEAGEDEKLYPKLNSIENLFLAFVGSGPYPATAILLKEQYPKAKIRCIDNNITAHLLGKAVSEKAGIDLSFEFAEAIEIDYRPFNAVFIAAMIGNKEKLVQKILDESQALIFVRGKVNVSHKRLVVFDSYAFSNEGTFTFKKN